MNSKIFFWGLLGAVSGVLSSAFFAWSEQNFPGIRLPSIFFGIILCLSLYVSKSALPPKLGSFFNLLIFSYFSFNIAVFISGFSFLFLNSFLEQTVSFKTEIYSLIISGFLGGFTGGLLLLTGLHLFILKFSKKIIALSLTSGMLGMTIALTPEDMDVSSGFIFLPLFIIWQAGMMMAIAYTISDNKNKDGSKYIVEQLPTTS